MTSIDTEHLALQTCGDKELQRELLALYATQAEDACRFIDRAIGAETGDIDSILAFFHRLKGSARAIGAVPLGDVLDGLERALTADRRFEVVSGQLLPLQRLTRESAAFATMLIDARPPAGLAKSPENG